MNKENCFEFCYEGCTDTKVQHQYAAYPCDSCGQEICYNCIKFISLNTSTNEGEAVCPHCGYQFRYGQQD